MVYKPTTISGGGHPVAIEIYHIIFMISLFRYEPPQLAQFTIRVLYSGFDLDKN